MKFLRYIMMVILPLLVVALISHAGLQDRSSKIELKPDPHNYIRLPDVITPSDALTGTPDSGWMWLFNDGDQLKIIDDSGNITRISTPPEYAVQLSSVFVDSVGPITAASAPNVATICLSLRPITPSWRSAFGSLS